MKIVCVEPLGISKERFEQLKEHYATMGHEFAYHLDRNENETTLIERMTGADIVVVSNIRLTDKVLASCPQLKYISVAFTGLDHIDLAYCQAHGIRVQNAAGYSTTAVSELAVGMMLDLLRNILTLNELAHQGGSRGTLLGRELRGKTVGIVGTGAIGIATMRLLLAFGAKVIAWSRTERDEVKQLHKCFAFVAPVEPVRYVALEELLRQSDIVSLHVPLCDETRGLIGDHELSLMKPTALLVNTARGPVCDIAAVGRALVENRIAGAAFDVFEQEPPLPLNHLLLSTNRCLVTPHVAFATEESFAERANIVFSHVDDFVG